MIARLDAMRRRMRSPGSAQRRYRTLEQEAFRELCQKVGMTSYVEHFLEYLHDCGLVFHPGMFNDQIILIAWALQAIYTALDRSGPYMGARHLHGR
ncbi:MAG: hypothetical protein R3C05_15280 [Pirellulaceae bacterium]